MSIQQAEQLKREWTDKYVRVQKGIPELRRFDKLVGQVKTVNMNCRLLIQFDTPADISWYDVDPRFVVVVDKEALQSTQKSEKPEAHGKSAESAGAGASATPKKAASAKVTTTGGSALDKIRQQSGNSAPASKPSVSPLDKIRAQSAAAAGGSADGLTGAAIQTATGGSPLDKIRSQASSAAGSAGSKPAATSVSGNPLDQIRSQAAGTKKSAAKTATDSQSPEEATNQSSGGGSGAGTSAIPKAAAATGSPLDQIRAQAGGAVKSLSPSGQSVSAAAASPAKSSASAAGERQLTGGDASTGFVANSGLAGASGSAASTVAPLISSGVSEAPKTANDGSGPATQSNSSGAGGSLSASRNTPFDQVRRQAMDSGDRALAADGATPIFDQIRRQAAADEAVISAAASAAALSPIRPLMSQSQGGQKPLTDQDVTSVKNPVIARFRGKTLPLQDDLKIIDSIGPKTEELFQADGITTWALLSQADTSRLKKILESAGPRFRMHDPETWPAQAKLAHEGQWQQLEEHQDLLRGGRPPEPSD